MRPLLLACLAAVVLAGCGGRSEAPLTADAPLLASYGPGTMGAASSVDFHLDVSGRVQTTCHSSRKETVKREDRLPEALTARVRNIADGRPIVIVRTVGRSGSIDISMTRGGKAWDPEAEGDLLFDAVRARIVAGCMATRPKSIPARTLLTVTASRPGALSCRHGPAPVSYALERSGLLRMRCPARTDDGGILLEGQSIVDPGTFEEVRRRFRVPTTITRTNERTTVTRAGQKIELDARDRRALAAVDATAVKACQRVTLARASSP